MSCHEATNEVLKSVREEFGRRGGKIHSIVFRVISFDYFMLNKRNFSRVIIIERKVSFFFVQRVVLPLHLPHLPMPYGKSKSSNKILAVVVSVNGVPYFVLNISQRDNISLLKSTTIRHSMLHDRNYVVHQVHLSLLSYLFHTVMISHRSSNLIQPQSHEMKMLYLGVLMFDSNISVLVHGYIRRILN